MWDDWRVAFWEMFLCDKSSALSKGEDLFSQLLSTGKAGIISGSYNKINELYGSKGLRGNWRYIYPNYLRAREIKDTYLIKGG